VSQTQSFDPNQPTAREITESNMNLDESLVKTNTSSLLFMAGVIFLWLAGLFFVAGRMFLQLSS
jgi:hypothetical protein